MADGAHTHGSGGGDGLAVLVVLAVIVAVIARPVAAAASAILRVVTEVLEVTAVVLGCVLGLAVLLGLAWLAVRAARSPLGRRAWGSVRVRAAQRSQARTAPRARVIVASPGGELDVRTVRAIEAPSRRIEVVDATTESEGERAWSRSSS
jgi:hypothetical protein